MSGDPSAPGSVFLSYAREDRQRVEVLARYLRDHGFAVWWDRDIEPGTSFRSSIQTALDEAACVVVVWTQASVDNDFVRSEASNGQRQGRLTPVLLDANARVPVGFTEIQYVDLSAWDGSGRTLLQPLVERIRKLVKRGPNKLRYQATLETGDWAISSSQQSIEKLRGLTAQVRSISHLFVTTSAPTADLRAALDEVGKTYRVVTSAIAQFVKPAVATRSISPGAFLKMERGTIKDAVEQGRGHCGLILTHYGKYGGLRDWIADKVSPVELRDADDIFGRLGTADGDLFMPLVQIVDTLTNESRVIVNLLLSRQEPAARQRIREGRRKLEPLELQLSAAMRELQQIEASIGYVRSQ
jgi:hypothetical protein